jgi:hypothetical protein
MSTLQRPVDLGEATRAFPRRATLALRRLARHDRLIAFGIYLAAALCLDRAAVAHFGSTCACGLPGDPPQYTWSFVWFPHALFSGLSLLHTHAMWSPGGVNLAGATTAPLLAFALAPVTWIWGPIVSYNVVALAAPVSAAWCAFMLCRHITHKPWASVLAGATYGFSSYMTTQGNGHLHLVIVVCAPLAALAVLKFVEGSFSKRRLTAAMTVILVAQFYLSTELFFTLVLMGATALALAWIVSGTEARGRIVSALPPLGLALLLTVILSSWYLIAEAVAPDYKADFGTLFYNADALSFLTPMPYSWIGGHVFTPVTQTFQDGWRESGAYLGLPLVLLVARYIWSRWERPSTKLLAGLLAVAVLCTLGPKLYIAGKPTMWLPYSLVAKLPIFKLVMQSRFVLYVSLVCAVILAMWLGSPSPRPLLRWSCGLVALAFILPNLATPFAANGAAWTNPVFFKTNLYRKYLHPGETVLPIPWGSNGESAMWQAETHMYFNMASGLFIPAPPPDWKSQLTDDLEANRPDAGDTQQLRGFLHAHHVTDVVVLASSVPRWGPTLSQAGLRPTPTGGGVTIYRVPLAWLRTPA